MGSLAWPPCAWPCACASLIGSGLAELVRLRGVPPLKLDSSKGGTSRLAETPDPRARSSRSWAATSGSPGMTGGFQSLRRGKWSA